MRVVVTGIGSVSALGAGGGAHVAEALGRARSALAPVQGFSTAGCPSHLGAEAGPLDNRVTADEARRLPRVAQLAVVACRLALADAGLAPGALPGLGIVLGSHWGDLRSSETFARGYLERGPLGLSPLVFPYTVMNGMAAQAAIALGARGPLVTVNQAGIAGEVAVARAALLVQSGRAPAVLAGGVDELSESLYRELARLRAVSPGPPGRPGAPGPEGCWPFDRRANGTVAGEGASVVLLEAHEAARARGARVYAELTGAAWGNLPSPAHGLPGRRDRDPRVLARALAMAGVDGADLDAVYLTGAGDPEQDACELDLLAGVLDSPRWPAPPLTALTPLGGDHAGLGVLRVAGAAAATLAAGRLPGLPDLAAPVREDLPLARGPLALAAEVVLVHGLARGGAHAALVLAHPEREAGR